LFKLAKALVNYLKQSRKISQEALFLKPKTNKMATKITINNNGSIKVEGDFTIEDRSGNTYDLAGREVIGLCRCGLSKNKPFCDGAHNGNFTHEATAFALPPKKTV
jgi:CDGSH-type Zn-finger protein